MSVFLLNIRIVCPISVLPNPAGYLSTGLCWAWRFLFTFHICHPNVIQQWLGDRVSKDLSRTYFKARTFICILNLFSFSDFRRSISVTSPSPRWVFKLLVACCLLLGRQLVVCCERACCVAAYCLAACCWEGCCVAACCGGGDLSFTRRRQDTPNVSP